MVVHLPLKQRIEVRFLVLQQIGESSNGRTDVFGASYWGSNPYSPASFRGETDITSDFESDGPGSTPGESTKKSW